MCPGNGQELPASAQDKYRLAMDAMIIQTDPLGNIRSLP
jgi:hypothetical protein